MIIIIKYSLSLSLSFFSQFGHKFNPVYKTFCTNFEQQRGYIKSLEKIPIYHDYLRVSATTTH